MRLSKLLGLTWLFFACSAPLPLPPEQRLALLAYSYALDSLQEIGHHAVCVALSLGSDSSAPHEAVLRELRQHTENVLPYRRCSSILRDVTAIPHDTLLITANIDSANAAPPVIRLYTWRGGRWGSGHRCTYRRIGTDWLLDRCQLFMLS